MKKIIVTAANGFLGRHLVEYLSKQYEVVALVRRRVNLVPGVKYCLWDGKTLGEWQLEFEHAFCVINLAGRSVDCRYNDANKQEIYASRLESTRVVGEAIDSCVYPPTLWINSASATIYCHSEDMPMTEENGEEGTGFSVDVCQRWEQTFFEYGYPGLRQVALRTAIVFGTDGGALVPMVRLAKLGMGGKQGKGNQIFSWIHIEDFCRAVEVILEDESINGPVNLSSPFPVPNTEVMRSIRRVHGVPFGLPAPKFLLELGARIIRTETELILKSRFVIPEKLISHGFIFKFPNIDEAIYDLKTKK